MSKIDMVTLKATADRSSWTRKHISVGSYMPSVDIQLLITVLIFGLFGGYMARELVSRRRHRRWREKHWY
jgi:hypothetical protein